MKSGLFYGAGWNAEKNIERWIQQGYDPYCFIDENPKKQNTLFAGKYEILSLRDAMAKYKGEPVFITLTEKNQQKVINSLQLAGVDRSNIKVLDKMGMNPLQRAEHHILTADEFLKFGRVSKDILDIGCGNGVITEKIADYYNVSVQGIDVKCKSKSGYGWSIKNMDARNIEFEDNSFDAIISIATLEHLPDLDKVLSEMFRVLRPNGRAYMMGGPIWTCEMGNHYNHHLLSDPVFSILPPFCHLYMSKIEMFDFLCQNKFETKLIDKVIYSIYESDYLNRYSATDIVEKVSRSDFRINGIDKVYSNIYNLLPDKVKIKLSNSYLVSDLKVNQIIVKLSKL